MFARFDENPAMTLRVIKETKRYGRTDARTDGQRENSIPPTNKVCGGYNFSCSRSGPALLLSDLVLVRTVQISSYQKGTKFRYIERKMLKIKV